VVGCPGAGAEAGADAVTGVTADTAAAVPGVPTGTGPAGGIGPGGAAVRALTTAALPATGGAPPSTNNPNTDTCRPAPAGTACKLAASTLLPAGVEVAPMPDDGPRPGTSSGTARVVTGWTSGTFAGAGGAGSSTRGGGGTHTYPTHVEITTRDHRLTDRVAGSR
jgi:hypothetical protein